MYSLLAVTTDQIIQIAVVILILVIAWAVLKTVLRLTLKIFSLGCGAILVLGMILVVLRMFNGS
ncbi:MAG: hypothetical protein EHM70_19670 [Chloroflexota bacterium]|nr:MAG: hypothetical protein EHM70_19670 [Chloroflexota bacterium]